MEVYAQIEELGRMRIGELRERYQEVFGEPTTTAHKQHLVRRIAWKVARQQYSGSRECFLARQKFARTHESGSPRQITQK